MALEKMSKHFLMLLIGVVLRTTLADECVLKCDKNITCVTEAMRCDTFLDCDDLADEENCKANDCDGLPCSDGSCIRNNQHCDGHIDCSDQADEIGCSESNYRLNHPTISAKELCMKPCKSGKCYFDRKKQSQCKCDEGFSGVFCENGPSQVSSKTPEVVVYNYDNDKRNENDVITAQEISPAQNILCKPLKTYLDDHLICNGNIDCEDGSDEDHCTLNDYKKQRKHSIGKDLCLMPCVSGKCKFGKNQRAYCECMATFKGTFCETALVSEPNTLNKGKSEEITESSTASLSHVERTTLIDTVPEKAKLDRETTTRPAVTFSTARPTPSLNDVFQGSEGSKFRPIVVLWILPVVGLSALFWILIIRPCNNRQYDNAA